VAPACDVVSEDHIALSKDSWVEANYRETQIGRMKVGDPVRIDAPGTGPYPLAGRPAGACHRSAGRRSLFGWRTQPTRFGGFRRLRASLVVPLRKDNNFLGVGTTPFALANRLGFEIGSTRNRPPRRAARNALLPGPIEQVGGAVREALTASCGIQMTLRRRLPRHRPEDHAHMLAGLRKAGMPEE
jgi:hypothetical protein